MGGSEGKEARSSFSEEKEAKRLYPLAAVFSGGRWVPVGKVFWFFFSKKNFFLPQLR
jgi:hypothetical protein